MKLDLKKIKSIACGVCQVYEDEKGIRLVRFSEREENYYKNTAHESKIYSSAGIALSFRTNSEKLKLKINTLPASTRSYFSVDIWEDHQKIGLIKNFNEQEIRGTLYPATNFPLGQFEGEFKLKPMESDIKIVFPWAVSVIIESIEIDNNATLIPIKGGQTVLCYGDSITQGYDSLYASNSYINRLSFALCAEVFNKGIGGECFCPRLGEIKSSFKPDIITVAYGTNDWCHRQKDEFENNCRRFYKNIFKIYPETKFFAITPLWRDEYRENRSVGDFLNVSKLINEVCKGRSNVTVIEGFDIIPHDKGYFGDFRLHPNDEGFKIYADKIAKIIKGK